MIEWMLIAAATVPHNGFSLSTVLASSLGGAIVSLGLQEILDYVRPRRQQSDQQRSQSREFSESDEMTMKLASKMPNEAAVSDLYKLLCLDWGGAFVVAAPSGAGKTTVILTAVKRFKNETGRRVEYFQYDASFTKTNIKSRLNVPRSRYISETVIRGTVLIIDQLNCKVLDSQMSSCIVELATESRNTKKFHVILCVSHVNLLRDVAALNGEEKIDVGIKSGLFLWDRSQVDHLARALLPHWSEQSLAKFISHTAPSRCPGTVLLAASRLQQWSSWSAVDKELRALIMVEVQEKVVAWKDFEEETKGALLWTPTQRISEEDPEHDSEEEDSEDEDSVDEHTEDMDSQVTARESVPAAVARTPLKTEASATRRAGTWPCRQCRR